MKKTVNIIMYCIYLLVVIITTYILLYLFVSKKNFEILAGVKAIFLLFPENYYTLKQDLRISNILYLFDITPWIQNIENVINDIYFFYKHNEILNTIEYTWAHFWLRISITLPYNYINDLITLYRVCGTFMHSLWINWYCFFFIFAMVLYNYWMNAVRIFYIIKDNIIYIPHEIPAFWRERWRYFIDRSCFLIMFFIVLQSILLWKDFYYPWIPWKHIWTFSVEWKLFKYGLLNWTSFYINANFMYIISSDNYFGYFRYFHEIPVDYFWLK